MRLRTTLIYTGVKIQWLTQANRNSFRSWKSCHYLTEGP